MEFNLNDPKGKWIFRHTPEGNWKDEKKVGYFIFYNDETGR